MQSLFFPFEPSAVLRHTQENSHRPQWTEWPVNKNKAVPTLALFGMLTPELSCVKKQPVLVLWKHYWQHLCYTMLLTTFLDVFIIHTFSDFVVFSPPKIILTINSYWLFSFFGLSTHWSETQQSWSARRQKTLFSGGPEFLWVFKPDCWPAVKLRHTSMRIKSVDGNLKSLDIIWCEEIALLAFYSTVLFTGNQAFLMYLWEEAGRYPKNCTQVEVSLLWKILFQ